jgi:hypothetical protein
VQMHSFVWTGFRPQIDTVWTPHLIGRISTKRGFLDGHQ